MPVLFEPTAINGMQMKNRFVRSATYEAMAAKDGTVTDQLLATMAELASGGVGLIMTGHSNVTREGQAGGRQMGIYADTMIDGLKKLTATVHENGGVVAVQLAHAGLRSIGTGEYGPLGPCNIFEDGVKKVSAMTESDIKRTISAFGDAAERAVKCGFDAVQIHAAHGYLLSQFLAPCSNKRSDNYGGKLENRARFLVEVYREIRRKVGPSCPVMAKINSEDFLEEGFTVEEMIEVARMLEKLGLDAIEMSGGTFASGPFIPSRIGTSTAEAKEVYYREAARAFKKEITIPLILVGGFLSFASAEGVVTTGLADYVALSRPLVREPHLIQRWEHGDRTKASCISCNKCFATLFTEEALHCAAEKR
ncbi:NADH:flavin oxidoreductase [Desulfopila sp. IMCC35006]|uniref:oxidoreductase n=1 Tax=Desulfopila sp. IMCC35006 TaxID=2569542 RepID=UPI0010AC4DC4|nr:NADH:flavin oxidoreductase [Desulfopila sp. IMCC35006]TKB23671.1 NADH:flavin oxidoreductase [Desulfopila sp. IMCC35006]